MGLHREYFYRHDLQVIPELRPPKIPVSVRLLALPELELLHEIWPVDLKKAAARLTAGHSCCYLTSFEGRPIAYQWVQFEGRHFVQQAGQYISLRKGQDFMIYHTRVKQEFQSKGINTFLLLHILHDFAQQGYQHGYIYTSAKNIANIKGIQKIGFVLHLKIPALHTGDRFITLKKITLPIQ
jgi:GNAT superfamily N-acetyltransferase